MTTEPSAFATFAAERQPRPPRSRPRLLDAFTVALIAGGTAVALVAGGTVALINHNHRAAEAKANYDAVREAMRP